MKLALIGDPVAHSRSPQLHRAFFQTADIEGSYEAIEVGRGGAAAALARLRRDGYAGCNVTYPLKEEAAAACDRLSGSARRAGAVNTIAFSREVTGTNTDGVGARMALEALLDQPVALKRVGVLGCGATARAILGELHDNDAYTFVWGRDPTRVRAVCEGFEAAPWPEKGVPEIVVSTLPPDARLPADIVASLRAPDLVVDANYGPRATLFRQLGREVVDGSTMLAAQARGSFDFWLTHIAC